MTNEAEVLNILLNEIKALEKNFNSKFEILSNKIDETRAEMASMKEALRTEIASTAESVKTELRAEMASMKEELKAEIKKNRDDILTQASDMARETIDLIEKSNWQHNKRFAHIEVAVFGQEYQVHEDGSVTYDCKND